MSKSRSDGVTLLKLLNGSSELDELCAQNQCGLLALIVGAPGTGKSKLARNLQAACVGASSRPSMVITGPVLSVDDAIDSADYFARKSDDRAVIVLEDVVEPKSLVGTTAFEKRRDTRLCDLRDHASLVIVTMQSKRGFSTMPALTHSADIVVNTTSGSSYLQAEVTKNRYGALPEIRAIL